MKRTLLTAALILIMSALYPHAASKVTAEFDNESKNLSVSFDHKVGNPEKHYISDVSVELNGKEIITQKLTSQDDGESGTLLFRIAEAKPGDKILVKTKCSRFGNRNFELSLEQPAERKGALRENIKNLPKRGAPEPKTGE